VARKPRPPPLSIRLPPDERAELKARADREGLSVSGYFRTVAFNTPPPLPPSFGERPAIAEAVGSHGQDRLEPQPACPPSPSRKLAGQPPPETGFRRTRP
jgi:hypothetical protein